MSFKNTASLLRKVTFLKEFAMKKIAIVVLALATIIGSTETIEAQNRTRYTAFRVRNSTNRPIVYQVNWNNQGWVLYTIYPGQMHNHWRAQVAGFPAPAPFLSYDNQRGAWSQAAPPAWAGSYDPNGGFSNNFTLINDGRDLIVGTSSD